jgi:hypothetical protein
MVIFGKRSKSLLWGIIVITQLVARQGTPANAWECLGDWVIQSLFSPSFLKRGEERFLS